MTRFGTSYFVSRADAVRYYRAQYGSKASAVVAMKLAEGNIHVGEPELKPNQRLLVSDLGTRYVIIED